jgi:hypothetical protein
MVVMCDTYDWSDYPAYIVTGPHCWLDFTRLKAASMQKVMEVYDLRMDMETQLNQHRAYNVPPQPEPSAKNQKQPATEPSQPATRDELLIENHELKKQVEKLEGQVEAFLQQEQHPLRVLEYVLKVAWYDVANLRVVIGDRDLYADKLGEEFLKYVQEDHPRRHAELRLGTDLTEVLQCR